MFYHKLSNLFGLLSLFCLLLAFLRIVIKHVIIKDLFKIKSSKYLNKVQLINEQLIKYHNLIGIGALFFSCIHFLMKYVSKNIINSGYLSIIILLIQVVLGLMLVNLKGKMKMKNNPKSIESHKLIFKIHTTLAIIIVFVIGLVHVLLKL